MKLSDLCNYTKHQSENDAGDYYEPFITAQELLEELK